MNAALVGLCMVLGIAVSAWMNARCEEKEGVCLSWFYALITLPMAFGVFTVAMLTRVTVFGMNAAVVGMLPFCGLSAFAQATAGKCENSKSKACKLMSYAAGAVSLALMVFVFAMLARVTV